MRGRTKAAVLVGLMLGSAFVAGTIGLTHAAGDAEPAVRSLPDTARCGETVQVTLTVEPPSDADAWILDEVPPDGVTVSNVDSDNSGEHVESGHVKWVSTDGSSAVHTYDVTVPSDATDGSVLVFDGEYNDTVRDERVTVGGETDLAVTCGAVTRTLPSGAAPGETVTVQLDVDPGQGTDSWIIDEVPPDGLTVSNVDQSHSGERVDSGHVKWVSTGGQADQVTYDVTVPTDAAEGATYAFAGEYNFTSTSTRQNIAGDAALTVERADRQLPATAECGDAVDVTVSLSPPPGTESWLAEETLPDGWTASEDASSSGIAQQTDSGIKFTGAGDGSVTLAYQLEVPDDAQGTYAVTGEHRFHPSMDDRADTAGDETISVTCPASTQGAGAGGGAGGGGGGTDAATGTTGTSADDGDGPGDGTGPGSSGDAIQAEPRTPPSGASGAWTAGVSGAEGETVTIEFGADCVPSLELTLGEDLDGATVWVTTWPSAEATGPGPLPEGVSAPCIVEVEVDGSSATHDVALNLELEPGEVSDPGHALLFHGHDGSWETGDPVELTADATGALTGTVRSTCCSLFALGVDDKPPQVALSVPDGPLSGTVNLTALAVDNVGVDRVEFAVDGDAVGTVSATGANEAYVLDLDTSSYEDGEHAIEATAYDRSGRAASEEVTRTFGDEGIAPPIGPGTGGGWLTFVLLGAAALASVGGVVVYRRYRPEDEGGGPSAAPAGGGDPGGTPPPDGSRSTGHAPAGTLDLTALADPADPADPQQGPDPAAEAQPGREVPGEGAGPAPGTQASEVGYPWAIVSEPPPNNGRPNGGTGGWHDDEPAAGSNGGGSAPSTGEFGGDTEIEALHERIDEVLRRSNQAR